MRVDLRGGFYKAKNLIANVQSCLNLYPEQNPSSSQPPVPVTTLLTPGSLLIAAAPVPGVNRGIYSASNGNIYTVIGHNVYYVAPGFVLSLIGSIGTGTNPVSMADNGLVVLLVDGTPNGYTIILSSNTFAVVSDPAFYGADKVEFVNNFFLLNKPGTRIFYSNIPTDTTPLGIPKFSDATFTIGIFGEKTIYPDSIQTIAAVHGEVLLLGTKTSEVWYNAGNPGFSYSLYQGVCIEHGCIAKYSAAKQDISVYWLSQDLQGQKIVLRYSPYQVERISTHAIEAQIDSYPIVSDAIGFTYQEEGHQFYVLTFPTANATWVYDQVTELWHQRSSTDVDGNINRIRANSYATAYTAHLVGDFQYGNLLVLNLQRYTDYIDGRGPNTDGSYPISRIRAFPHMLDNGDRVVYKSFTADMDVGENDGSDGSTSSNPPVVSLRWSDNRGASYGNKLEQSLGATGEYLTSIQWNRLGMARDRVFEVSWSASQKTAINGAFIELEKAET